jgi:hypothetical protein
MYGGRQDDECVCVFVYRHVFIMLCVCVWKVCVSYGQLTSLRLNTLFLRHKHTCTHALSRSLSHTHKLECTRTVYVLQGSTGVSIAAGLKYKLPTLIYELRVNRVSIFFLSSVPGIKPSHSFCEKSMCPSRKALESSALTISSPVISPPVNSTRRHRSQDTAKGRFSAPSTSGSSLRSLRRVSLVAASGLISPFSLM